MSPISILDAYFGWDYYIRFYDEGDELLAKYLFLPVVEGLETLAFGGGEHEEGWTRGNLQYVELKRSNGHSYEGALCDNLPCLSWQTCVDDICERTK